MVAFPLRDALVDMVVCQKRIEGVQNNAVEAVWYFWKEQTSQTFEMEPLVVRLKD